MAIERRAMITACGLALSGSLAACTVYGPQDDDGPLADPLALPPELIESARLTPVAEGEILTAELLDHALDLRGHYGLSTDVDFVATLHEHPEDFEAVRSGNSMFGGLVLEPSELPAALERAEMEYRGPDAARWAQDVLGERYGGSFLEGQKVILQCADCDPDQVAADLAAERDLPETLLGRVEVREVPRSFHELARGEAELAGKLAELGIENAGSMVDIHHDEVDLHAPPSVLAAVQRELPALEMAAGGRLELIADDSEIREEINKNEAFGYGLVEAGQGILTPDGMCTSAFAVQNAYGPFILTAGHCVQLGQGVWQGGPNLGHTAARAYDASMDVAAISTYGVRTNWGRIHIDTYNDRAPVTFVVNDHQLYNQTVCNSGRTTSCVDGMCNVWARCGIVVTTNYRSASGGEPIWALAGYMSAPGDSGAGIYWPTAYGHGGAGIHKGRVGDWAMFTKLSTAMWIWGLSLSPY